MNKNSNLFITILYRDNLTVSHMNYLFSASHSEVFECLLMSSENILVLFTRPLSHQKQYATVSLLLFASFYLIFIYFHFLYEKKTPNKTAICHDTEVTTTNHATCTHGEPAHTRTRMLARIFHLECSATEILMLHLS